MEIKPINYLFKTKYPGWYIKKGIFRWSNEVHLLEANGFFRVKPDNQAIDEINLSLLILASYFLLLHISPPRRVFDSVGFLSLFSFLEE